jgi:hypothetical protein
MLLPVWYIVGRRGVSWARSLKVLSFCMFCVPLRNFHSYCDVTNAPSDTETPITSQCLAKNFYTLCLRLRFNTAMALLGLELTTSQRRITIPQSRKRTFYNSASITFKVKHLCTCPSILALSMRKQKLFRLKLTWSNKYRQNSQSRHLYLQVGHICWIFYCSGFAGYIRGQGSLPFISFWFTCAGRIDKCTSLTKIYGIKK